jgi:hypothetical protein
LLLKQKLLQDFIPDTAKENHKKGTVVAVGNGTKEPNDCENWRLFLRKICGTELKTRRKRLFDHA